MIYVYDLILNWTDGDNVYEFFEWELSDELEHIKKIPLFKINSSKLDEVLNYEVKIENDFLNKVYNLTEKYNAQSTNKILYAAILTDGARAIAIELDDEGKIIYRSKLLIDEEEEINTLSNKLLEYELDFNKLKKRNCDNFTTRMEQDIKKLLTIEIKDSYKMGNFDKLKYLYYELFEKEQDDIDSIYKKLLDSLDKEINYNHNKLYEVIKLSYQGKS